jgi:hypothetical protein
LLVTNETIAFGATSNTVGLRLDDRRRVALHVDTHDETEVDGLFVGEAELFGELMDAHVLWQLDFSLSGPVRADRCGTGGWMCAVRDEDFHDRERRRHT